MILLIKINNTVHRTIEMKPIDITDDFYVKSNRIALNILIPQSLVL